MTYTQRFFAIVVLLMLSSCSAFISQDREIAQATPESKDLRLVNSWSARGKFYYASEEANEQGNFAWRQIGDEYQLRLFGPLGMGAVRISGNANLVRIQNRDQDISSDQPLSLLYRITGFKIPLNSMPKWLLGLPASLSPSKKVLMKGQSTESFSERGWGLSYNDFKDFDDYRIATTVQASKGDVSLKMRITHWETP